MHIALQNVYREKLKKKIVVEGQKILISEGGFIIAESDFLEEYQEIINSYFLYIMFFYTIHLGRTAQ